MKIRSFPGICALSALLLASCSDTPQGKFQEEKKNTTSDTSNGPKFIHNVAATKWQNDWSTSKDLVYHWRMDPDNLHPTNGKTNPRRVVLDYTQRFLIGNDLENQGVRPDLIKKMPTISADGLRYEFELRDEPTWDDGSPLTADDVEFSLKAFICPYTDDAYARPYFETFAGVEKDPSNPKKFTVIYTRKYIQNLNTFGDVVIMERKFHDPENVLGKYTIAELNNPDFTKTSHPDVEAWAKKHNDPKYGRQLDLLNGLGAYRVTAWEEHERLELTKKPNHWTSKVNNPGMYDVAYPEKIIFKLIQNDDAINLELKKQTIDVSTWILTHSLVELQSDSNFNRNYFSAFVPNFNYQFFGFNMKPEAVNRTPFFTDKRVRRAMALLVPADKMNQDYLDGKALRMTSLVSPVKRDVYNTSLKPLPYDVEQAKKLLDEAGWKDTDGNNVRDKMIDGKKVQFAFDFLVPLGNPVVVSIAKDAKNAMHKAGVEVNLVMVDGGTLQSTVDTRQFDMVFWSWGGSSGPEDYKQIWSSSSWANKGSNFTGFGTPESDALIEKIRVTIEDSARIPMEKKLQEIVYDEQPYIFLYSIPTKIAIHKRLDHPDMYYDKPGVYLSNLRPMTAGTMATTMAP